MKHDIKVCLYDIEEAIGYILEFTAGMSLEEYCGNALVKAAVERKSAIIGEALVRLRREQPELLESLSESEKIIGFRNVLVHGYDMIEDATVWSAITSSLPILLEEVQSLLSA
ncbi:MAG: HepT-like ribonuclease domain-containing protein [Candidatus Latescibacterota bacterium]